MKTIQDIQAYCKRWVTKAPLAPPEQLSIQQVQQVYDNFVETNPAIVDWYKQITKELTLDKTNL